MSTTIKVRSDGALSIRGEFRLLDRDENEISLQGRTQVVLCSCGESGSPPFCDGTHYRSSKAGQAIISGVDRQDATGHAKDNDQRP